LLSSQLSLLRLVRPGLHSLATRQSTVLIVERCLANPDEKAMEEMSRITHTNEFHQRKGDDYAS